MSEKMNRQALRSKRMLCEALLGLLKDKPLPKISIQEIADKADLSRSTFYTNFESREAVLEYFIDSKIEVIYNRIMKDNFNEEGWAGESLGDGFLEEFEKEPGLVLLMKTSETRYLIVERMRGLHHRIYEEKLAGNVPGLNEKLVKYFIEYIAYTTFAVANHWINTGMQESVKEVGGVIDELLLPVGSLEVIQRLSKTIK